MGSELSVEDEWGIRPPPAPRRRSRGDGQHRGKQRLTLLQAGHPGCTCRKLPAVLVTELGVPAG